MTEKKRDISPKAVQWGTVTDTMPLYRNTFPSDPVGGTESNGTKAKQCGQQSSVAVGGAGSWAKERAYSATEGNLDTLGCIFQVNGTLPVRLVGCLERAIAGIRVCKAGWE